MKAEFEYIDETEMELFQHWYDQPEPKPSYIKWFYIWRKEMVSKLFTLETERPE